MDARTTREIAAAAARLIAEEGLDYAGAKQRAARALALPRGTALPDNAQVEDAVREHLALFAAERHPHELRRLRELACRWMRRLAPHRPHLAGAAWRGTATYEQGLRLELYCDDPKLAELDLVNGREPLDLATEDGSRGAPRTLFVLHVRPEPTAAPVALRIALYDRDELRGALKPDRTGRTWRGDLTALERTLAEPGAPSGPPA